jgi:hypothetical protein
MTTLMDIRSASKPRRDRRLGHRPPLDPSWDNASESRSRERSFKVESRGGYPRTRWEQSAMIRVKAWTMSRGEPWPSHPSSSDSARSEGLALLRRGRARRKR